MWATIAGGAAFVCALTWLHLRQQSGRRYARALLCPSVLSASLTVGAGSTVVVQSVDIVRIHRCGDGVASTTDRIVLDVDTEGTGSATIPRRLVAKTILLHWLARAGASLPLMQAAGDTARWLALAPWPLSWLSQLEHFWCYVRWRHRSWVRLPDPDNVLTKMAVSLP